MHFRSQILKRPLPRFAADYKQESKINTINTRACSPREQLQKQKTAQRSKIVKISELINKNICLRKEIDLKEITNIVSDRPRTSRKKKLDISLSKQKAERERSISERPTEQSSKVSLSNIKSIRKIKCFQVNQEVEDCMKQMSSTRRMKDIENSEVTKGPNNKTKITLGFIGGQGHNKSRRKIKIMKHNK